MNPNSLPEQSGAMSRMAVPFAGGGLTVPKVVLGIDPGASAGSVTGLYLDDLRVAFSYQMPPDAPGISDLFKQILTDLGKTEVAMTYLEMVRGYVNPNTDKAQVTFHSAARLCKAAGIVEGVLAALGIPYQELAPNSWHRALKLPKGGAYTERKKAVYTTIKQRYPKECSVKRCDSIAIALAGVMKLRGK